jgi:hypothetical protein
MRKQEKLILDIIEYQTKWLKIMDRICPKWNVYMITSIKKSNVFVNTYYVTVLHSTILGLMEAKTTCELTYPELNQIND